MAKVLVLDNVARDTEVLCKVLASEQLEAVVCHPGNVERALASPNGTYAAIFLPADPPDLSGLQLIVRSHQCHTETPIIVISGTLDAGLAMRAHALGAKDFLERPLAEESLQKWLQKLLRETDPLLPVVDKLRAAHFGERGEQIIGESPALIASLREVAHVLPLRDSRVLILGEPGTGKELFARAMHELSPRANQPWVAVNVLAIPSTLVEATLFGQEKGAFTDARESKRGLLEAAGNGTLFLDEIGDMEQTVQGKLLRAIQEREFRRLGGTETIKFSARLICATNRNLDEATRKGDFRRDLYDRIAEIVIKVPPLRERISDIPLLLAHVLQAQHNDHSTIFSKETLAILLSYHFPGNIRELQNLVHRALLHAYSEDSDVLPRHLPIHIMSPREETTVSPPDSTSALTAALSKALAPNWQDLPYREVASAVGNALDRVYLPRILAKTRHNITRAAQTAGMDTKTFRRHWSESGLPPLGLDDEHSE